MDRIADPWGERTPYARGAAWPVRVDEYLESGCTAESVDRWVQTASVLHSNGDGMDIAVKDGRIVGVRGRAVDRVNHGRVDPKDLFGWQANNSADRLTVRSSARTAGSSRPTGTRRWAASSSAHGRSRGPGGWGRFGFYTSGQLFLEEYYTLAVIGKAGIGTPHMDGNTRLCTATAAAALKASFGTDGQPGSYPTSTTATRSRCGGTTSRRRKPCCGCACSTAGAVRIRRGCSRSTPVRRRWHVRPTSTSRHATARTRR